MYSAEYSKRLVEFNNTEKYQAELAELERLLQLESHHTVLDFGCGIGTAILQIGQKVKDIRGYDVNFFEDSKIPSHQFWKGDNIKFDRIYFMHSLAHMVGAKRALKELVEFNLAPGGKIVVITPNKSWLLRKNGADFKSDDTVIEHFTIRSIHDLFHEIGMVCETISQFSHDRASDFIYEPYELKERLCCVAINP